MIEVDQLEIPGLEISGKGLYPAQTPGERPCVLLVEDDPALRRYLEVVLQRAGYEVASAGDGLEAMKVLLAAHVDVIVTDALMPNLDAWYFELVYFDHHLWARTFEAVRLVNFAE